MSTIRVVNIQHSDATEPNIVLEADGTTVFASGITISGGTNLTVSGTAEFASGTVSAPGIAFIADNNTGIYEPAADTVAITTAATERLRVDSAGRLLVQSSSAPTQGVYAQYAPLTVQGYIGSTTGNGILNVARGATASSLISGSDIGTVVFSDSAGGEFARISCFADAAPDSNDYPGRIGFYTTSDGESSPTERLRIDSSGRVGVGTSAPVGRLTVVGSAGSGEDGIQIASGSTTAGSKASLFFNPTTTPSVATGSAIKSERLSPDGSDLQFYTVSALGNTPVRAMTIDKSQQVGIGTTSPTAKVDIEGSSSAEIALHINNTSGPTSILTSTGGSYSFAGVGANTSWLLTSGDTLAIGPYTANGITKFVTNSAERMRIDSSGRVGIGTPSPSNLLHLNASGDTAIRFDRGGTKQLNIGTDSGQSFIASFESKPLAFATSTSSAYAERMRIDSSGRLLVGTSTARTDYFNNTLTAMLQVEGTAASGSTSRACVSIVNNNNLTNFETPILVFGRSRGSTLNSKTLAGSGTRCGHISFQGADGSDMVEAAFIAGEVDGDSGANDMPGRLVFSTTADGASSSTERMRIDSSGRLGIGTSSPLVPFVLSHDGNKNIEMGYSSSTTSHYIQAYNRATSLYAQLDIAGNIVTFKTLAGSPFESARIDSSGRVLVGTSSTSLSNKFLLQGDTSGANNGGYMRLQTANSVLAGTSLGSIGFGDTGHNGALIEARGDVAWNPFGKGSRLEFSTTASGATSPAERMRITSGGALRFGQTTSDTPATGNITGATLAPDSYLSISRSSDLAIEVNRKTNDGSLMRFLQDGTPEGTISVSGTTVSYNGAHLSRWSQLPGGAQREEIQRGTVLSNIDEMCEWGEEENEQLNRMKVSEVEGDPNVSGVFQAWDDDDDTYTNDFYCAMTGDFIIRIAEGVTVQRGDLLMSAGDGTAKPQDDDIIRSKTVAKVTSTHVTCTYDDGSYCVPCVLMAC